MTKSSNRIRATVGIAGSALGIYILYDIFRNTDIQATVRTIESLSLFGIILILLPSTLGALIDSLGWRELLPIQTKLTRQASMSALWNVLRVRIASEAVVQTVPLGSIVSDPLKAWLLRRSVRVSLATGISSVALRMFLLAESQSFIVFMVSIAELSWLSSMSDRIFHNEFLLWSSLSVSIIAIIVYTMLIIAACSGSLTHKLQRRLSRVRISRLRAWIVDREKYFLELNSELATFANERRSTLLSVIFLYVILWSMEGVETYIILRLLGVSISFSEAYAIEAICSFIRSVAIILPSGLGAQDAGYVAFLNTLGVNQPVGVAFVLIKRLRQLVWIAVGGLLLLAFRRKGPISSL